MHICTCIQTCIHTPPSGRLVVAGGGGGAGATKANGGAGGLIGSTSVQHFKHLDVKLIEIGQGGTQTEGGFAGLTYLDYEKSTFVEAYPGECVSKYVFVLFAISDSSFHTAI